MYLLVGGLYVSDGLDSDHKFRAARTGLIAALIFICAFAHIQVALMFIVMKEDRISERVRRNVESLSVRFLQVFSSTGTRV